MKIFVKTLPGKTVTLQVKSSELLKNVKEKIKEKEGIPICHQILVNGNNILDSDNKSIGSYKVTSGSTLHLILLSLRWNSKDESEKFKDRLVESMTSEMNKEVQKKTRTFKKLEERRTLILKKICELEEQHERNNIEYEDRKDENLKYRSALWEYYYHAQHQKKETDEKIKELKKLSLKLESTMKENMKKMRLAEKQHLADTQLTSDKNGKLQQEIEAKKKKIVNIEKEKETLFKKMTINEDLVNFLSNTIETKKKDLECPVCLETAETPIYMCSLVHLVCKNCRPSLTNCPECRKPYPKRPVRHRFAEKLDDEIKKLSMELKSSLDRV